MKDDNIYLVKEESTTESKGDLGFAFHPFAQFVKFKRVIPYPAIAENAFCRKVNGQERIAIMATVYTGLTLRYQENKWKEDTTIEIQIPIKYAEEIARCILRTAKRSKEYKRFNLERRKKK